MAGAPKGNNNAVKVQTKKQWSTRLSRRVILRMKHNAARHGLSLAEYIEKLIINDKP